jgi:hypothetical protein
MTATRRNVLPGVKTPALSHVVPGTLPAIPGQPWLKADRLTFAGNIVVGRDLVEI